MIAIAIPIFSSQLEKANEGKDAANIRSAYATVAAYVLLEDTNAYAAVDTTQDGDFQYIDEKVGGQPLVSGDPVYVCVTKSGDVTITATEPTGDWVEINPLTGQS